jgi:hypothetical protein
LEDAPKFLKYGTQYFDFSSKENFMKYSFLFIKIGVLVIGSGCKFDSGSSSSSKVAPVHSTAPVASDYNPQAIASPLKTTGKAPELGSEKTCDKNHQLISGYCVELANLNVFSNGTAEFYGIGEACKTTPSSCDVPESFTFKESRLRVLVNPPEALKEFLTPLDGAVKGSQLILTVSPGEIQSKVAVDGFVAKGVIAYLLPFPVGDGKKLVRFESSDAYRYGLSGYDPGEGFIGSSLGYAAAIN